MSPCLRDEISVRLALRGVAADDALRKPQARWRREDAVDRTEPTTAIPRRRVVAAAILPVVPARIVSYSRQRTVVPAKSIGGGESQLAPEGGAGALTVFGKTPVKLTSYVGALAEPSAPDAAMLMV